MMVLNQVVLANTRLAGCIARCVTSFFLPLFGCAGPAMVSKKGTISLAELQKHAGVDGDGSFWTAINGKVYDFTSFVAEHPGGPKIIRLAGGRFVISSFCCSLCSLCCIRYSFIQR